MSKPILEINQLSKRYRIHGRQENYLSARDAIRGVFKRTSKEDFWALKEVSFDVEAGDSIGVIGKNGAGKSTLLKILSRITPPTSGTIVSRGRIASLLEVGTGFHGELSGRENVFMNGSILGMRKQEIIKNFDAIVDFAGVEQFIDTPLKHYSSGMQLRLAFAVAAFLENEILIIDEVLAVGDAEFQKKCLGKMSDVSRSGRTILFVSHNIGAVKNLCNKGVVMHKGELVFFGDIDGAINHYNSNALLLADYSFESETKDTYIKRIQLFNNTQNKSEFLTSEEVTIVITLNKPIQNKWVGVSILDNLKNKITTSHYQITSLSQIIEFTLPANFLTPGFFSIDAACFIPGNDLFDYVHDECAFSIVDNGTNLFYDSNFGSVFNTGSWLIKG